MARKYTQTERWIKESHLVGDTFLPRTVSERKAVTKVFGQVKPTKQHIKYCKNLRVGNSERKPNSIEYLDRKKEERLFGEDFCRLRTKFEQNGLSSFVDEEMRKLYRSKFLNNSRNVLHLRKYEDEVDTDTLFLDLREDILTENERR